MPPKAKGAAQAQTFLGRDEKTWGPSGIGWIDVADSECSDPSDPSTCPPPFTTTPDPEASIIHVQIASYRDRLCPRTLYNLFTEASNPSRIYVRLLLQTLPGSDLLDDADCFTQLCETYNSPTFSCTSHSSNVLTVPLSSSNSLGPTSARSKLSSLLLHDYLSPYPLLTSVTPSSFCLQIDSHMSFSPSYDISLLKTYTSTKNEYAILSTYASPLTTDWDTLEVPNLCMFTWTTTFRNWGTKACKNLSKPKLTTSWGAGVSFGRVHAEINVGVDPFLDGVFDGEEFSRVLRYFTHGYDIYTPPHVLISHDYKTHQSNPLVHTWSSKVVGKGVEGGYGGG
ncbi:hypothetical protein TrST_g11848 [Triparma strigata]|uniref:Uncharacterized protein n=1 Tax=Triparma strigata TaxID=1606541 RepID=A0A9W7B7H6_9STRA|nr:hypothetical protein TrST_g11848 [Triparma strigata]